MTKDQKTIFAIRISEDRSALAKQLIALFWLLLGMTIFFSLFASVQYYFCWREDPNITVRKCLVKKYLILNSIQITKDI